MDVLPSLISVGLGMLIATVPVFAHARSFSPAKGRNRDGDMLANYRVPAQWPQSLQAAAYAGFGASAVMSAVGVGVASVRDLSPVAVIMPPTILAGLSAWTLIASHRQRGLQKGLESVRVCVRAPGFVVGGRTEVWVYVESDEYARVKFVRLDLELHSVHGSGKRKHIIVQTISSEDAQRVSGTGARKENSSQGFTGWACLGVPLHSPHSEATRGWIIPQPYVFWNLKCVLGLEDGRVLSRLVEVPVSVSQAA